MAEVRFGRVVEGKRRDLAPKAAAIAAVLAIAGLAAWGFAQVIGATAVADERDALRAAVEERDRTLAQRDALLAEARNDEALLRSPGAAIATFVREDADAVESGVIHAHPEARTAKVYLFGLGTLPQGREYVLVARGEDGARTALAEVLPSDRGDGFALAREVPEGTVAVELATRAHDEEGIDAAEPRVAARWPAEGERGVLGAAPARVQARRAAPASVGTGAAGEEGPDSEPSTPDP
jgi:hypothetical protein